jgi:hypothetical protein
MPISVIQRTRAIGLPLVVELNIVVEGMYFIRRLRWRQVTADQQMRRAWPHAPFASVTASCDLRFSRSTGLTIQSYGRISRALANIRFATEHEPSDEPPNRNARQTFE